MLCGVDHKALTRLEAGDAERYNGPVLAKLCAFYGVGLEALLEYDPNAIQTLELMGGVTHLVINSSVCICVAR
jgi:hypothetical protein